MEIMVNFTDGERNFSYELYNVKGFTESVKPHLPPRMKTINHDELPWQSLKVSKNLPYKELMRLCHQNGRPITKEEYDKRLATKEWYTSPSIQSSLKMALIPMNAEVSKEFEDRYTIAIKPGELSVFGRLRSLAANFPKYFSRHFKI